VKRLSPVLYTNAFTNACGRHSSVHVLCDKVTAIILFFTPFTVLLKFLRRLSELISPTAAAATSVSCVIDDRHPCSSAMNDKHITAFSISDTQTDLKGKEAMSLNMPEFSLFQRITKLQVTNAQPRRQSDLEAQTLFLVSVSRVNNTDDCIKEWCVSEAAYTDRECILVRRDMSCFLVTLAQLYTILTINACVVYFYDTSIN